MTESSATNGFQGLDRSLVLYLEPISVLELLDRRFTFVSVNSDPVCITPNIILLDFGRVELSTGFLLYICGPRVVLSTRPE